MPESGPVRIQRGPGPPERIRKAHYRADSFQWLKEDFKNRCAYTGQLLRDTGEVSMKVDHFNPRHKKRKFHKYSNLMLASEHANTFKGNKWPTKSQRADGLRFLNPCEELDYGSTLLRNGRRGNLSELRGLGDTKS